MRRSYLALLIAVLLSALPLSVSARAPCDPLSRSRVTYSLRVVEVSPAARGFQARLNGSLMTPLGMFSVGAGRAFYSDNRACMLIIRWAPVEQVYELDGPVDVKLAGVGQGMVRGATVEIERNERTGNHLLIQISGTPQEQYFRQLAQHDAYYVFKSPFNRRGWLGVRVVGSSTFSIRMAILRFENNYSRAVVRVEQISRYWEGNWGQNGPRERDIPRLPYPDERDPSFHWPAPKDFGSTVILGETYLIPAASLQPSPPF